LILDERRNLRQNCPHRRISKPGNGYPETP